MKGGDGQVKSRSYKRTVVTISTQLLSALAVTGKALHYTCAAHKDERKGFPLTAAMEWRQAAEHFAANTVAAEYCWRQWQRIMRMPRELAGPIGVPAAEAMRFAIKDPVPSPLLRESWARR